MKRRERRAATGGPSPTLPGRSDAATPAALREPGLGLMRAERYLEAQMCCQQALALDPDHAGAQHLMGLLSIQSQQYDHAIEWISRAIRRDARPEYLMSLGAALQFQRRYEEALQAFEKAVQLAPEDADHWTSLGKALVDLERQSEAVLCFQHALKLAPRHGEAAWQAAVLLRQLGRPNEALVHFNLCDELRPRDVRTIGSRALVLRDLKKFQEYLADSRQAQMLEPTSAEACNNVGDALVLLGRFEEALEWFDRALELQPSAIFILENKALVLKNMHCFDELFRAYDQIRSIDPGNANTELTTANTSLLLGDFETGWRGREARFLIPDLAIGWSGPGILWLGEEEIRGKAILIYSDEGLGDALQFARYIPMLASLGARIVLMVPDSLCSLLSALPVWQCLPMSAKTLPAIDMYCPINSLPLAFRTRLDTIPPPVSLSPPLDRMKVWEERLGAHDRLRVGLVWSGNPDHKNDHNRSIPLRLFSAMLGADAEFISLQKDLRPEDRVVLGERSDILDLTAHLTDYVETSALVSCLDLVITVDTSVAHLAGTLGRPAWILLPYTPDHRWLLDRHDSPWYPSVHLFRQGASRSYAEVIDRIRAELAAMVSEFRPPQG
jgi:tetratricopeptide (TPR) repeat protein